MATETNPSVRLYYAARRQAAADAREDAAFKAWMRDPSDRSYVQLVDEDLRARAAYRRARSVFDPASEERQGIKPVRFLRAYLPAGRL